MTDASPPAAETISNGWRTIRKVSPYLWPAGDRGGRIRVVLALLALILAKVATVATPFFFKAAVDALAPEAGAGQTAWLLGAGAIGATLAYGVLRFAGVGFAQLRDAIFARVGQSALRQ